MNTECDMRKRVSDLECIGRKICTDLRNFQKERSILSQEAKCLLRKLEKDKIRERHYNKKKRHNTGCICAIWEKDLIKNGENDLEETSKFRNEDEQLLTCGNSCGCRSFLDEENYCEDLFDISKCSNCRFDELDKTFHWTQSATIINHNDDDDDDDDNDDDNINNDNDDNINNDDDDNVKDNVNDVYCMIKSSETSTIDPTEFCDICVFCKENNAKNIHVLSTKHKLNINNKSDVRDLIERERGGGGNSDSESTNDETTNTSICTCNCDICALRNKHGDKPPCCFRDNEQLDSSIDVDYDENLQLNSSVVSELSEIHQYCKITKLREALEKLKNHNHTLRKLLKKRDCLITNSMMEQANYKHYSFDHSDDNNFGKDSKSLQNESRETPGELTGILKIYQSKCRTKDGMIVALADELKECATNERIKRILDKLTHTNVHCNMVDFDRSTLWKYLSSKECNIVQQHSHKRKSIVCRQAQCSEITIGIFILSFIFLVNVYYRYRYTVIFVFHTTCETFYRAYEILQNFQQCFASNNFIILIMKNCINYLEMFLSLFNCQQLDVNMEKITRDFTFFNDDGFPWLSTLFICATILILFSSYRTCYPFITMCCESFQHIYDMNRNNVRNVCG